MKYVSKPAECEAWQFTPRPETGEFVLRCGARYRCNEAQEVGTEERWAAYELWVEKSQAWCEIQAGDFIIKEPDGTGFYPCAKDIFEARWTPRDGANG